MDVESQPSRAKQLSVIEALDAGDNPQRGGTVLAPADPSILDGVLTDEAGYLLTSTEQIGYCRGVAHTMYGFAILLWEITARYFG